MVDSQSIGKPLREHCAFVINIQGRPWLLPVATEPRSQFRSFSWATQTSFNGPGHQGHNYVSRPPLPSRILVAILVGTQICSQRAIHGSISSLALRLMVPFDGSNCTLLPLHGTIRVRLFSLPKFMLCFWVEAGPRSPKQVRDSLTGPLLCNGRLPGRGWFRADGLAGGESL